MAVLTPSGPAHRSARGTVRPANGKTITLPVNNIVIVAVVVFVVVKHFASDTRCGNLFAFYSCYKLEYILLHIKLFFPPRH